MTSQLFRFSLLVALLVLTADTSAHGAAAAKEKTPAKAATPLGERHVYKKVGERELRLYVARPTEPPSGKQRPAIVFFHGGGWTGGAPDQFNEHARYLITRGLVCVQVEYRLLGKGGEPPIVCIQDAKSAMRWVRRHAAQFGVDPQRIAAGGGSAGGHLAAFVGLAEGFDDPQDDRSVSPKPNALVLFNPVFDNGPEDGWGRARVGERYREFSPAHNISRDDPPVIVFLGTEDRLIPVRVAERFKANMAQAGVRCELVLYEGQPHGFFNYRADDPKYFLATLRATDEFLASLGWLSGPPTLR